MLLLGLDFETTGLRVEEDRVIEIGAVLWDTSRNKPVQFYSELVCVPEQVSDEITGITGIEQSDLEAYGIASRDAFHGLSVFSDRAEAIVAHNGNNFDKPFCAAELRRNDLSQIDKHWIDTSVDVPYPPRMKTRSLVHLAAEHGFVNPFPHRALSDVLTMFKVMSFYDAEAILKISKEPNVQVIAIVKEPWKDAAPEGKKETDKAKARGFRFDGSKKCWQKTVKLSALPEEESHGEFPVRTVVA